MRRAAIAVACSLHVISMFAGVTPPTKLIGPDLTVQKPVVTTGEVGIEVASWRASWLVRNAGNQASPATQLKVVCTTVYVEGKGGCADPQTVAIPPLAPGDSFNAQAPGVFMLTWNGNQKQQFRFSLVATANPTHAFKELDERNNQVSFTVENFQGTPQPPTAIAPTTTASTSLPPKSNAAPAASSTAAASSQPAFTKLLPHMELTTDPKNWSFKAPFWVILKNVDATLDAKDVVVTAKCEAKPPASPLVPCLFVAAPPSLTIPSIPHGSFKALYQIQPPSDWGVTGSRLTFHVEKDKAIANDLVLNTIP